MDKDDDKIITAGQKLFFETLQRRVQSEMSDEVDEMLLGVCFRSSFEQAITHHEKHVKELKLQEGSVEVYKTVSWHVWHLAEQVHSLGEVALAKCVLNAGLETLNTFVSKEQPNDICLDDLTLTLICTMLMNELENLTEHGIAKNGLYIAYKTAKSVKTSIKLSDLQLKSSNF